MAKGEERGCSAEAARARLRHWELQGGVAVQKRAQEEEDVIADIEEDVPADVEEQAPPMVEEEDLPEGADDALHDMSEDVPHPDDSEDDRMIEDPLEWAALHPTFAVKVYRLSGGGATTVDIRGGSSATVRELKLAVMVATGVPSSLQRLTHESEILRNDEATLESVGLQHGMSIILDELESHKLTEVELQELQSDFFKRIDAASKVAGPATDEIDVAELPSTARDHQLTAVELDLACSPQRAAECERADSSLLYRAADPGSAPWSPSSLANSHESFPEEWS